MKNKKGFTLIELLVVITIMGIITILALPGVQQIQNRNRNKKYEAYADTIESAGKLYTDAYADDMFGMEGGSGCAMITYADLKGKSLIKDYEVDGISCDDPGTFIRVDKEGEKYKYTISLNCKKDGKYVYETTPEVEPCEAAAWEAPTIEVTWKQVGPHDDVNTGVSDKGWSKEKDVTIKVAASEGLIDNISIMYGWSTDPNNPPSVDQMTMYNYRNAYGTIEDTLTFHDAGVDASGNPRNGEWYLYVTGEDVIDIGGRVANNYRSAAIKFDNTAPDKPTLTNSKDNIWTGIEFVQADSYKVKAKSDDDHAGVGYYQYCYASENCADTGFNEWHIYTSSAKKNFTSPAIKEERNEYLYIRACDRADNCSASTRTMIKIDLSAPKCNVSLSNQTQSPTLSDWYYKTAITMNLSKNDTDSDNNESVADTGWYEDKCSNCESGISKYSLVNSRKSNLKDNVYNSKTSDTQKDTPYPNGITWYGYVEDGAGNITECNSGNFKADVTIPTKPVLTITGDATLTVKMCSTDATTGLNRFVSRVANSGTSFSTISACTKDKLDSNGCCTITTAVTLEIKAVDDADNYSESTFTRHCNGTGGGKLEYSSSHGWICTKSSSTIHGTCSGLCGQNYPCGGGWSCATGYAGAGTYCTRWVSCTYDCSYTGCASPGSWTYTGGRCIRTADGG